MVKILDDHSCSGYIYERNLEEQNSTTRIPISEHMYHYVCWVCCDACVYVCLKVWSQHENESRQGSRGGSSCKMFLLSIIDARVHCAYSRRLVLCGMSTFIHQLKMAVYSVMARVESYIKSDILQCALGTPSSFFFLSPLPYLWHMRTLVK